MIQLEYVEIKYFRSIYRVKLTKLTDVVTLAGRNDVGKSNILKALNLFFNNHTDWNTSFDFNRDFSQRRLSEVRKETIKGRQYVQVTVGFIRGARSEKSLPDKFNVTKTWYRDSQQPEQKSSLPSQYDRKEVPTRNLDRALASLQRYLNAVRFEYVPAIKEQDFFTYILGRLQDLIFDKRASESNIADAVKSFNTTVEKEAGELKSEFYRVTGISTDIRLPNQLGALFRAFAVATKSGDDEMPLNMRGDGIRSRFLPSLLYYISKNSRLYYIWGFEEPENSIEHGLASKLAEDVVKTYAKPAQILITSHSPAFFSRKDQNVMVYRVYTNERSTALENITAGQSNISHETLGKELGLMEFQQEQQNAYETKIKELEIREKEVDALRIEMHKTTSPVLLTEGKWDVLILTEAWKRLYPKKSLSYRILHCDPMLSDHSKGGSGGAATLKSCIETVRPDEPITIGLFDRDKKGFENGFQKLNANFRLLSGDQDIKIQEIGTSAAIVLPVVAGRERYAEALNLMIEFLFEDKYLSHTVNGKGLILEYPEIEQTVKSSGLKLPARKTSSHYLRIIHKDSKKIFAEDVVPSLPDDAFEHFKPLFQKIQKALNELHTRRKSKSA